MRRWIMVAVLVVARIAYAARAQSPAGPLMQVHQIATYKCLSHPQFQATWPTRCPRCQMVLRPVQSPAVIRVGLGPLIDAERRRQDEDEARARKRQEELRQRYPNYRHAYSYPNPGYTYVYPPRTYSYGYPSPGYTYVYPPKTYSYQYPSYSYPDYGYNPNQGYASPYAYNGYYYNPNTGYYYPNHNSPAQREEQGKRQERQVPRQDSGAQ